MAIKILMPALSPTMQEGKINKWIVKIGDRISSGDIIAEVETDKATMEVEAVDEGTITHIIESTPNSAIKVNSVIALLNGNKNDKIECEKNKLVDNNKNKNISEDLEAKKKLDESLKLKNINLKNNIQKTKKDKNFFASPYVKKISKEQNIDLHLISGSGPQGRIVKKDLENNELNTINDNANIIEPSNIRKIIAERTAATKQEVPHFYLTVESKVDKLISLRNKININNQRKISYNDLIVKAIGLAIHKNPKTNVSWINNKIHMYRNVDISVAVALDDGLITPIVRNAQNKGINEISNEIKELVNKAKHNKLVPDEYTGGSITVSNLGMYGITEFSAIINPPQSSIIAIGAIIKKPIIVEEKVLVGHTMKSTLSADHRAIDGAIAGKLIKDFNDIIENPFEIWLNCNDMKVI